MQPRGQNAGGPGSADGRGLERDLVTMQPDRSVVPGRRPNPLRELLARKDRSAAVARSRERIQRLEGDLPGIISEQVEQHMARLGSRLVGEFKEFGQKAVDESANAIAEQFTERLDTLEQISAIQSRTLVNLKTTSNKAEQQVSSAVDSIEKTLSNSLPGGFKLDPPRSSPSARQLASTQPAHQLVKADRQDVLELDEMPAGKYVYCPNCTSTRVRRAYRDGIWEEFLRLFFIAPFRCRACRYKFYRF